MLTTPLCRTLGITAPIFSVGMGALAGPALAAAVSNTGACGVLGRVSGAPTAHLRQQIRQVRALTDKPFGVNIILATLQAEWIDICLAEQVPLLVFFWGDPRPYVPDAHRRGIKVLRQVGSVAEAQAAAEVGVDGIIAQGLEAGGHVKSTTALSTLLPAVVEAVAAWEAAGRPAPGQRPGEGTVIGTAPRGDTPVSLERYTGPLFQGAH